MPGLLYTDDLVLCGESEEDLRAMVKINVGKSKVMVLDGEDGFEYEVCICRIRLDVFWMNQVQMRQSSRKVASGRCL